MNDRLLDMFFDVITSERIQWNRTWDPMKWAHNIFTWIEYSWSNIYLWLVWRYFATFNQISKAGWSVKRGAKSLPVFYSIFDDEKDPEGKLKRVFKWHRFYLVFDVESDTTGLEDKIPKDNHVSFNRNEVLNGYLDRELIPIEAGDPAYSPLRDVIKMPAQWAFHREEFYWSTLAHEIIHSTWNQKRLWRPFSDHKFWSVGYAQEELIAEIGAVMLTGNNVSDESKAYIQSWLLNTKASDDKAKKLEVYRAFTKAKQASEFVFTWKTTKTDSLLWE